MSYVSLVHLEQNIRKNLSMKRLILLILLVCWVFNDNLILAKSKTVLKVRKPSNNTLHVALQKVLKSNLTELEVVVSGGAMNNGYFYQMENNQLLYVKENSKPGSEKMFHGEVEGLKTIRETGCVPVPEVLAHGSTPENNHYIVMKYIKLVTLTNACSAELGYRLGQMHTRNLKVPNRLKGTPTVKKFGFHVETSNAFIPQNNTWTDDWITFFTVNRMAYNIKLLESTPGSYTKKEKIIENYWPRVKKIIPKFFEGINVKPSLLHGDLWVGNTDESEYSPVVFDPAAFYGHHEYDIALLTLFGGYLEALLDEYLKVVPKDIGFDNRMILYQMYHYLNHWIQFGKDYSDRTIEYFEKVLDIYK